MRVSFENILYFVDLENSLVFSIEGFKLGKMLEDQDKVNQILNVAKETILVQ